MKSFPPDSGTYGAKLHYVLSDEEREVFMKHKDVKKLIRQNKVGVEMYEVWIFEDDPETEDILEDVIASYWNITI